jgi:hypothetical protein
LSFAPYETSLHLPLRRSARLSHLPGGLPGADPASGELSPIETGGGWREPQRLCLCAREGQGKPTPVVFVFHGHGGTAFQAGRSFAMHKHWPEAISVYLQGLNTPGKLTDPEGKKPGWQHGAGAEGDRDLKLFDAVMAT